MIRTALLFILILMSSSFSRAQQKPPAAYVNPFVGTGGHGHTFPGATVPFGMVQLSPDTRIDGSWDGCGGYHYSDSIIYGFSHTHLSGTGVSDYGDILLMPVCGKQDFNNKGYASTFKHSDETASAGYYSVKIHDRKVRVELTASARTGFHRYTFSEAGTVSVVLDLTHRDKTINSQLRMIDSTHFCGFRFSEAWAKDQRLYFDLQFSKPAERVVAGNESDFNLSQPFESGSVISGKVTAVFYFTVRKGESILIKCALSAVDETGALNNLKTEIPHWDFEKTKKQSFDSWNKELGRIEIKGGTEKQRTIFYTALYHCMIAPNIYNDTDGRYRGRDMQIHKTVGHDYYTVFSLWDTFRALHPLLNLIDKKRSLDFIRTMLLQYEQAGLLPVWELSSNETECMIGYHSVAVIADALAAGITDFDISLALKAMRNSAEFKDRFGLADYMNNKFLSSEDEHESVSKTLEYAYDDWCIAQTALHAGDSLVRRKYLMRAQSWKNLFDPETRFLRPRQNGNFLSPFDPCEVNNHFTEANAWQYTFFVPHDITGLAERMGGFTEFEKKLDSLFSAPSKTTGRQQADITGLIGQYAHGNEPSHHVAYLYNYCAAPWKTQERVRQIMNDFYTDQPDGLIGNEDCGQMSAWYVMSAMGFYSVTPASGIYAIGSPVFDEVKINLENKRSFVIRSANNSTGNLYIQSARLNGNPYSKTFIRYDDFKDGALLEFTMGSKPQKNFGTGPGDFPVQQMSSSAISLAPLIKANPHIFKDSILVTIEPTGKESQIYYSVITGTDTTTKLRYEKPFYITTRSIIKATAIGKDGKSGTATAFLYKIPHPERSVHYLTTYSNQYTAGGNMALIDGIRGDINWRKGNWQGFWKDDMELIIDLGSQKKIKSVTAGFLQDIRSWIFYPLYLDVKLSTDGQTYTDVSLQKIGGQEQNEAVTIDHVPVTFKPAEARYVKVSAKNFGRLPEWHPGYEYKGQAWIFCDEIQVE